MPLSLEIREIRDLYEAAERVKGNRPYVLYRIDERQSTMWDSDGDLVGYGELKLTITAFPVLRRTPKGAWIESWNTQSGKQFICFEWNKQFACETPGRALEAYRARRRRQIGILEARLRVARLGLMIANGPTIPASEASRGLELPHRQRQIPEPI